MNYLPRHTLGTRFPVEGSIQVFSRSQLADTKLPLCEWYSRKGMRLLRSRSASSSWKRANLAGLKVAYCGLRLVSLSGSARMQRGSERSLALTSGSHTTLIGRGEKVNRNK